MRKFGSKILIFVLVVCMIPVINIRAEGESVSVTMECVGTAQAGEEMILKITVGKPAKALAGLEFALIYNSEFVTPVITENTEDGREMDALVKTMPKGWEQMCTLSKSESKYYFRFAMPEGGGYLNKAGGIVLEIPFQVNTSGKFNFRVPSAEIIAVAGDSNFSLLTGKGVMISVTASGESEKYAVELGERDTAPEGGLYYLDIEATNLGDSEGIIGLEFALKYNDSVFAPYITDNSAGQMDAFMVSMPEDSWEQMCTLYESESKLVLRFAALHAESITESEKLAKGESIKLSIPFKVIGAEGDSASFVVNSVSALGINNDTKKIVGRGDKKSVSVGKSTSAIPSGLYEIESNHLLYVTAGTEIPEFLKPLNGLFVTHEGKRVESGLVKTGYVLTNGNATSYTIVVKGDVNGNGEIDSLDYILTKRAFYKTYSPDTAQKFAMTVTGGEVPSSMDYVLIKRHYFGTYNINK